MSLGRLNNTALILANPICDNHREVEGVPISI